MYEVKVQFVVNNLYLGMLVNNEWFLQMRYAEQFEYDLHSFMIALEDSKIIFDVADTKQKLDCCLQFLWF